ncbi:MAG: FAD-binding protein [Verrucomicrobia bacterium]|nr:FAD-binding protein [Verrucomicrobiota bacterium]HOC49964.1 FAD-linked oxidase C-terminal domain-containing protein [Verrucomicrobiota bacterium]HPW91510.1 FAD-linked oxidase C-terminal domain-containing protein [Verrucomicrobiota bacterium]HQB72194.1 FAD-linked oxidase C-terminal domain-containing protein [Verrucomicrobiota bacterium]
MNPKKIKLLRRLQRLLSPGEISFDPSVLTQHAGDKWFATHQPDAVVLARSTRSVATVLRFAHRHRIPVTARGAGHGYVGGCVPSRGGIVLSLARMNRIREINAADFVAVVQAGVNTARLQQAVEKQGLFYPPDPASRADNSIGGNILTNAGGPRCLKYGVTRDYVLGLEVVLPGGDILRLGGRTHKNKTGFDLHRLFVGSEGLLGVVTEATLKLLPLPPYRACLALGFASMRAAVRSLHAILAAGFLPAALELADSFTLAAAYRRTRSPRLRGCRAHLIVELDGQTRSVRGEIRQLRALLAPRRPLFIQTAFGPAQCEALWQIRREFSYALRDTGLTKLNEDIVVPRGRLEDLFAFAARLQRRHRLAVACFGHAGDGNIHTNLMVDFQQPGARNRARIALDDLFRQIIAWGGAITGEHGIGLAKLRWWPRALPPNVRALHQTLKQTLDPHGILNPGKFLS